MSAIERLEAADAAMTPGEWFRLGEYDDISSSGDPHGPLCFGHDYDDYGSLGTSDAEGIALMRNLLPEVIAVLKAAEATLGSEWEMNRTGNEPTYYCQTCSGDPGVGHEDGCSRAAAFAALASLEAKGVAK